MNSNDLASNQVFNNPLLLDMILKHVLWGGTSQIISKEDLKHCRLVCKQWIHAITKIFNIKHIPMLFLKIGLETPNKMNVEENEDKPSASTVLSSTFLCPPFQISIGLSDAGADSLSSISTIFHDFGDRICEMKVFLPVNFTRPVCIAQLKLTNLRKCLVVMIPCNVDESEARTINIENLEQNENKEKEESTSENSSSLIQTAIAFLNLIVTSATNLQELEIRYSRILHSEFEYEKLQTLPRSLKVLRLIAPVCSCGVLQQITSENNLKCLEEFSVSLMAATSEVAASELMNSLHHVFDKLVLNLRILSLECVRRKRDDDAYHEFQVQFPIFPNLTHLTLKSSFSKGWNCIGDMPDKFPKLESFTLIPGDETLLRNATVSSCPKLNKFSLVGCHLLTIDNNLARRVTSCFTNISSLELCTWGPDKSGLRLMFRQLKSLQHLKILVGGSPGSNAMDLDSLFTGISSSTCKFLLLQDKEQWESYSLSDFVFHLSIRQLIRLKSLSVFSSEFPSKIAGAFMSELSFHLAFFKMNNLLHLTIGGDIKVSQSTHEQWNELKKTPIVCNEVPAKYFLNP